MRVGSAPRRAGRAGRAGGRAHARRPAKGVRAPRAESATEGAKAAVGMDMVAGGGARGGRLVHCECEGRGERRPRVGLQARPTAGGRGRGGRTRRN